jgi:hypothetical protein
LYVDSNDTGSHILELGIGEDGNFRDEWPHGFFAERLEEILAD